MRVSLLRTSDISLLYLLTISNITPNYPIPITLFWFKMKSLMAVYQPMLYWQAKRIGTIYTLCKGVYFVVSVRKRRLGSACALQWTRAKR